jgi:transposase-like protein
MAIVWGCRLSVEEYAAAGQEVVVPRCRCPVCRAWMVFWSGYWRNVRTGGSWRIWVRRARCSACGVSHVLLPSFCLVGRTFGVEVIGSAISEAAAGRGTRMVARIAGVAQSTVRSWCRRHRERAWVAHALAVMVGVVAGLNVAATVLTLEMAMLMALDELVGAVCETEGSARWSTASVVTNGMWLSPVTVRGPTTLRAYRNGDERRLMALIDPNDGKRPP